MNHVQRKRQHEQNTTAIRANRRRAINAAVVSLVGNAAVELATASGFSLRMNKPRSKPGRKKLVNAITAHVKVYRGRWALANYWPATGRLTIAGKTQRMADAMEAIQVTAAAYRTAETAKADRQTPPHPAPDQPASENQEP